MSRTAATLPAGSRITDYISLRVATKSFPLEKIHAALAATGKGSVRQRDLPAHVAVYYVIAPALYMQSSYREVLRCLLEGIQWLREPSAGIKVAGNSGISQARTRLGWEPPRQLHDEVVQPIATPTTQGAWYGQWRLVSLEGGTLDVADEKSNDEAKMVRRFPFYPLHQSANRYLRRDRYEQVRMIVPPIGIRDVFGLVK